MVQSATVTGTSYSATGLQSGVTYYFTITAYNGTTPGTTSNVQSQPTNPAHYNNLVLINGKLYKNTNQLAISGKLTGGSSATPSPSGSVVSTVGPTIYDTNLNTYSLSGSNPYVVVVNGLADSSTSNVQLLLYYNGAIYYETASGNWYTEANTSGPWNEVGGDPRTPNTYFILNQGGGYIFLPDGSTLTGPTSNAVNAVVTTITAKTKKVNTSIISTNSNHILNRTGGKIIVRNGSILSF